MPALLQMISRFVLYDGSRAPCNRNLQICCVFHIPSLMFNSHIAVQPRITLTGLDTTTFSENTTVTVACTIERAYPELRPDDFQIRWGTQGNTAVGTLNGDKSYRYTVQYTQTLTREDDGTEVNCRVVPLRGQQNSISKPITVQCKYIYIHIAFISLT